MEHWFKFDANKLQKDLEVKEYVEQKSPEVANFCKEMGMPIKLTAGTLALMQWEQASRYRKQCRERVKALKNGA